MYTSLHSHQKLLNSLASNGLGVEMCRWQVGHPQRGTEGRKPKGGKEGATLSWGPLHKSLCRSSRACKCSLLLISPRATGMKTTATCPHNRNVAFSFSSSSLQLNLLCFRPEYFSTYYSIEWMTPLPSARHWKMLFRRSRCHSSTFTNVEPKM